MVAFFVRGNGERGKVNRIGCWIQFQQTLLIKQKKKVSQSIIFLRTNLETCAHFPKWKKDGVCASVASKMVWNNFYFIAVQSKCATAILANMNQLMRQP